MGQAARPRRRLPEVAGEGERLGWRFHLRPFCVFVPLCRASFPWGYNRGAMAYAGVKCKFCGRPIIMKGAPDIPQGVQIDASWRLKLACHYKDCGRKAEYPASELKGLFSGPAASPPKKPPAKPGR